MTVPNWASILEGLPDAVWLVDPSTLNLLAVNRAGADLMGAAPAELAGRPVLDFMPAPEDHFFWADAMRGVGDTIDSETQVKRLDGVAVPVVRHVRSVAISREERFFLVSMRDLTAERHIAQELERSVADLRATLESTADGILVCDLNGRIRNYNRLFAELWDVPEGLLAEHSDTAVYEHLQKSVLDGEHYARRMSELFKTPLLSSVDGLILRSGRILERVTQPEMSGGQAIGRVFSYRDISLRIGAESQLRLASKVFESSLEAIFITGPDFQVITSNPACEKLTCLPKSLFVGMDAGSLFFDPDDKEFFNAVSHRLTHEGSWHGRLWLGRPGQSSCAVEVSWVSLRNEQGVGLQTIVYFKDLTEELAAQQRIEQLAYSDVLTGLPNRLLLAQRVDFALHIAERNNGQFGIFFLDLDRFKNINDSMGHAFGDRVLIEVAQRIKQRLRDVDTLCRLGGDEFALFLDGVDERGAEIAARRILDALALPFKVDEMSFSVGASIGIALFPQDGRSLDTLIKCADTAMYQVKEQGRGSFRFYQPQMNADILSRMKMEHALRQALQLGRFRLHYQPQICLATGELRSAEALIRWTDDELGEVSPGVFIPLAEESGLIVQIGDWVLDEAVRQAAHWQRTGHPVTVSINVSAMQFQQSNFVERIAGALRSAALAPHLLELEMTESILVKDANEALDRLHELAALGVGLSIDDFGTGYSRLAYLKKFPISKLKIDRSFVMGLPADESDRAIVSATIGMAQALKLTVVAEGVETSAQRDYLADLKCESFQGFLCSPGLSAVEFERLAANLPSHVRVAA